MQREHQTTIRFVDAESGREAVAIVRQVSGNIAICLSSREDGDFEIVVSAATARDFAHALLKSVDCAGDASRPE